MATLGKRKMSSSFLRNCFGIIREVSGYCCNKQRDLILRTSKTVFLSLSNAKIKKKKQQKSEGKDHRRGNTGVLQKRIKDYIFNTK